MASVSSAGEVNRAGFAAGKSPRTQRAYFGSLASCQPSAFSASWKPCSPWMYSIFNCSIAAATSAGFALANSFGAKSSSAPALRKASAISLVESGLCALKSRASMTRLRFIFLIGPNRALNRFGNAIGVFVDLVELAALDQQPDFRFGSGITQKHAALAGELALHFVAQFHYVT